MVDVSFDTKEEFGRNPQSATRLVTSMNPISWPRLSEVNDG